MLQAIQLVFCCCSCNLSCILWTSISLIRALSRMPGLEMHQQYNVPLLFYKSVRIDAESLVSLHTARADKNRIHRSLVLTFLHIMKHDYSNVSNSAVFCVFAFILTEFISFSQFFYGPFETKNAKTKKMTLVRKKLGHHNDGYLPGKKPEWFHFNNHLIWNVRVGESGDFNSSVSIWCFHFKEILKKDCQLKTF